MKTMARNGFTFVEILVVTVLGAVILLATLQILLNQQRTYTAQAVQIRGTQATRGALDVLSVELREISPSLGDLVVMATDSVSFRAQRAFAIVCHDTVRDATDRRASPVGDWLEANDSVFVFADNDGESGSDDAWILTRVSAVDTTSSCNGADGQRITFPSAAPFSADSVSSGAQVRAFTHVTYGLTPSGGQFYLGRRAEGGPWQPVVGPVANGGVSFTYLDANGVVTTNATDVRQIEVAVRTGGQVVGSIGETVVDATTVRIHTRN